MYREKLTIVAETYPDLQSFQDFHYTLDIGNQKHTLEIASQIKGKISYINHYLCVLRCLALPQFSFFNF